MIGKTHDKAHQRGSPQGQEFDLAGHLACCGSSHEGSQDGQDHRDNRQDTQDKGIDQDRDHSWPKAGIDERGGRRGPELLHLFPFLKLLRKGQAMHIEILLVPSRRRLFTYQKKGSRFFSNRWNGRGRRFHRGRSRRCHEEPTALGDVLAAPTTGGEMVETDIPAVGTAHLAHP
jgi:hypothetical protein